MRWTKNIIFTFNKIYEKQLTNRIIKYRLRKFNSPKLFRRDDSPDIRLCEYLKKSSLDEQDGLIDKVSVNHNPVTNIIVLVHIGIVNVYILPVAREK